MRGRFKLIALAQLSETGEGHLAINSEDEQRERIRTSRQQLGIVAFLLLLPPAVCSSAQSHRPAQHTKSSAPKPAPAPVQPSERLSPAYPRSIGPTRSRFPSFVRLPASILDDAVDVRHLE